MIFDVIKKFVEKKFENDDISKIILSLYTIRNKHKEKFEINYESYLNGELDEIQFNSMIRSAELASYSHYVKNIVQEILRNNYKKTNLDQTKPKDILFLAKLKAHLERNNYSPIKDY